MVSEELGRRGGLMEIRECGGKAKRDECTLVGVMLAMYPVTRKTVHSAMASRVDRCNSSLTILF